MIKFLASRNSNKLTLPNLNLRINAAGAGFLNFLTPRPNLSGIIRLKKTALVFLEILRRDFGRFFVLENIKKLLVLNGF
jgi:hypothetical protein